MDVENYSEYSKIIEIKSAVNQEPICLFMAHAYTSMCACSSAYFIRMRWPMDMRSILMSGFSSAIFADVVP